MADAASFTAFSFGRRMLPTAIRRMGNWRGLLRKFYLHSKPEFSRHFLVAEENLLQTSGLGLTGQGDLVEMLRKLASHFRWPHSGSRASVRSDRFKNLGMWQGK
jgi:hypothetical protein